MHAGFEFQLGEHAAAMHFGYDFLHAAFGAFAHRHDFGLPALRRSVALVHAEQIAGEQSRLVAAGAGADFEDGVVIVHRVLGNQREANLAVEFRQPLLQCGLFGFRHLAHVGIGIVAHRLEIGHFGAGGAIGLDRIDHRP